jgi:hypothetical protein
MDSENGTFVKLGKICPILKDFSHFKLFQDRKWYFEIGLRIFEKAKNNEKLSLPFHLSCNTWILGESNF